MNLSRTKRRTLVDIYGYYKYKKNIQHPLGTTPYPFVKNSEVTDHKFSADFREWKMIVQLYLEKLKVYLEEGNSIQLGSKSGDLHLIKFKATHFIDFKKSREQGKVVRFAKNNIDNYFIGTSWSKKRVRFKLQYFWRIELNHTWLRRIYLDCEKDYTKIYKIRDSK